MIEEPGFTFRPPDTPWFRFADCHAYRKFSNRGIREMDFSYWDAAADRLVLLELKDYTDRTVPGDLVDALIAKGRDSLIMLKSVWRGDAIGQAAALSRDLPARFRTPAEIRLLFVLKVNEKTQMEPVNKMSDKVEWSLQAYRELLGIRGRAIVMNHHQAAAHHLPVDPT
jgi:hypothetical protein